MADTPSPSRKVDWKAVAIIFFVYIILYLTPILAAYGLFSGHLDMLNAYKFLGIWIFGGMILISGIAGYLSRAVTLLEPAIAGCLLFILGYSIARIVLTPVVREFAAIDISNPWQAYIGLRTLPMIPTLVAIFLLSLFGAWLGERAQKIWKPKKQNETVSDIAH